MIQPFSESLREKGQGSVGMTNAEKIMRAVATLAKRGQKVFSRNDVRMEIGINHHEWLYGYTAIFQGMREDQPGGAPLVNEQFSEVFRRIGHGRYVLTSKGESLLKKYDHDQRVNIIEKNETNNASLSSIEGWSATQDWFWEGNIQRKIIEYMESSEHFEILKVADCEAKKGGPDILAGRETGKRHVEVKGYPSTRYTADFPGGRKGERKKTQPGTQARHWFSEALLNVILAKSKDNNIEIALGFPNKQVYINLLERIRWLREKIGIISYIVDENGVVSSFTPYEKIGES
jgi:hypothetical protein